MEPTQAFSLAIESIFQKETVFFGLFLVGYYLQNKDKNDLKLTNEKLHTFITDQQDVLKDITREVGNIAKAQEMSAKTQEKHGERLERIESKLNKVE